MYQASVRWVEGEQFEAVSPSGHRLLLDSDRESNRGPGPMELLLVALGACSATDVVEILKKKRQALAGLTVELSGERAPDPPKVWTKIRIHFRVVGKGIGPRGVEQAIELSRTKYCSVAATLAHTASIEWSHTIEEA
ncbi:MAG TPA: OsmC family protein [Candidatus Xenobia bacterium]|nr:OsmC family protein [Candidatus Xenobia bacterium]